MQLRTLAVVAVAASAPALAVVGVRPVAANIVTGQSASSRVERMEPDRSITVTGDAVINVVPDRANLRVFVDITHAATAAAAAKAGSDRTTKILKAVTDAGIEPADVKTDQLSVNPEYKYAKDGSATVVGYTATRGITICIKSLKSVNDLVDNVMEAGATRMESLTFDTSDLDQRRQEARLMAVHAARSKAELLAKELGGKLGKPRTIQEGNFGWSGPTVYKNDEATFAHGAFVDRSFSPGTMSVNMQVTAVFDIDT